MSGQGKQRLLTSSFTYKEQDPDYKGDKVNYDLQNGPVEQRPCRDIFCALLFLTFLGGMGYIAVLAFQNGDPSRLASPFDSSGHQCKLDKSDKDYANYPFLFASHTLTSSQNFIYVCVKKCPADSNSTIQCKTMPGKVDSCDTLIPYKSDDFISVCLPSIDDVDDSQFLEELLKIPGLTKGFHDLRVTWPVTLGCVGVAIGISLILSVFMRYCAGCMVWGIIISLYAILAVSGTFCFLLRNTDWVQQIVQYQNFPGVLKDDDLLLGIAITCWSFLGFLLLLTCCFYKQIKISIGIMKAAADFIRQQCVSYFIPFYVVILQVGFLAFWITVILYLFSAGEVQQYEDTPFGWVKWNDTLRNFVIIYLFGLIWVLVYFSGLGKFLVSSVVAIWYFDEGKPHAPFLKSVGRSIKVFGSIAFGSLIITIVIGIRIFLQFVHKYLKQQTMPEQSKKVINCCLKYASCLIACFQRVIRFLTDNAYVMMAISGQGFCASASQAFYLMLRCTSQFFITNGTVTMFKWFGKLLISITTTFIGFIIITTIEEYRYSIFTPLFPVIAFLIVSYPIASTFMEFFASSAKTLLMCYCVEKDLAIRKGHAPSALRNFFEDYVEDSQYE